MTAGQDKHKIGRCRDYTETMFLGSEDAVEPWETVHCHVIGSKTCQKC